MYGPRSRLILSSILAMAILSPTRTESSDVFQYGQKRQAVSEVRKYCGRSLSSALQIICDGVYNSRFKKSNHEIEMEEEKVNDYAYNYELHPFKSLENAWRMLRLRRNSRGIYEECCLKSCTKDELRSYCGST